MLLYASDVQIPSMPKNTRVVRHRGRAVRSCLGIYLQAHGVLRVSMPTDQPQPAPLSTAANTITVAGLWRLNLARAHSTKESCISSLQLPVMGWQRPPANAPQVCCVTRRQGCAASVRTSAHARPLPWDCLLQAHRPTPCSTTTSPFRHTIPVPAAPP